MRSFKIGTLLVLAMMAGVLVAQNTEVVEFNLLFWRMSMSQIVLLLLAMAIGFVAGVTVTLLVRRPRHRTPAETP